MKRIINNLKNWQKDANNLLLQGDYIKAINYYEQALIEQPEIKYNYLFLGLFLLLQGQESEAQITWTVAIAECEPENVQFYTNELIEILQLEAERREDLADYSLAWTIRQHIKEINPIYIDNLLKLVKLSIKINLFLGEELLDWGIIEVLGKENIDLNNDLTLEILQVVLDTIPFHPSTLLFTEVCLFKILNRKDCFWIILPAVMKIGHTYKQPASAASFLELYLRFDPENIECLRHLAIFYQDCSNYNQGIETAKKCYLLSEDLADKIFAVHLILRGLMSAGGYWNEVCCACNDLESLLLELINSQQTSLNETQILRLLTPAFAIPHIKDEPSNFKTLYNQISQIFQTSIRNIYPEQTKRYLLRNLNYGTVAKSTKKLKIGYLSYALRRHSVGWLARWLFQHHDKETFETHGYFVDYKLVNDGLQEWYANQVCQAHKLGMSGIEIAEKIHQDEIDILVDLDSSTFDITCEVMALKPAPIQVTWLGWDASGIPAIDYYIADPYVLPKSAQSYYKEKIWRLPQTYIAVDGFETGVPTLHREQLDIPNNAIIYLSAQRGYKRHPGTAKLQMQVIKEVPNSYFLIKGYGEEESIKNFFYKLADEEGVIRERLRFLPNVALESVHRANLAIADVILDTYPYNGATTTLETLWMGIPLVTRVGEQFAARNSYTMMVNAGITEGIAWTDEEYIEWGVRLGKDEALRQQIAWKLRQSRQTAPLWNGKQFTREMENAYKQMWQRYVEQG